jgi:hypothetical protein
MLKMHLAAGLAVTALMAGSALAQTTAPTQPAGPGQVMTQMPPDLMHGSQLMGIDVYGADNQKIGDIDEVLVDRQGKIHGLVVGSAASSALARRMSPSPLSRCNGCRTKSSRLRTPTRVAMAPTLPGT